MILCKPLLLKIISVVKVWSILNKSVYIYIYIHSITWSPVQMWSNVFTVDYICRPGWDVPGMGSGWKQGKLIEGWINHSPRDNVFVSSCLLVCRGWCWPLLYLPAVVLGKKEAGNAMAAAFWPLFLSVARSNVSSSSETSQGGGTLEHLEKERHFSFWE